MSLRLFRGKAQAQMTLSQKTGLSENAALWTEGRRLFHKGNQMENPAELHAFTAAERDALYKTIFTRRDVRGQFKPDPIPEQTLSRILYAAHHAPSVGFMQPWNFLVLRSPAVKQQIHQAFLLANEAAATKFDSQRSRQYKRLKLEGILESPINICITCDRSRTGPVVLGRTSNPEMDLYSSVCAVQNLWLAARAEGVGVGWVSIIEQDALRKVLAIPDEIVPIAYLCLGYVSHFFEQPELLKNGWLPRLPLTDLVYFDQWGEQKDAEIEPLLDALREQQNFPQNWS